MVVAFCANRINSASAVARPGNRGRSRIGIRIQVGPLYAQRARDAGSRIFTDEIDSVAEDRGYVGVQIMVNGSGRQRSGPGGFEKSTNSSDGFNRIGSFDGQFLRRPAESPLAADDVDSSRYRKLHKNQSPRCNGEHPNERHQSPLLAESKMKFVEQDTTAPLRASLGKPDRVVANAKLSIGKGIGVRYVDNSTAAEPFDYGGIDRVVRMGSLRRNAVALQKVLGRGIAVRFPDPPIRVRGQYQLAARCNPRIQSIRVGLRNLIRTHRDQCGCAAGPFF